MKNSSEEKIIKELLQNGTKLKVPVDFSIRVLEAWKVERDAQSAYAPLNPRWIRWFCGILICGIVTWGLIQMSTIPGQTTLAFKIQDMLSILSYTLTGLELTLFPAVAFLLVLLLMNVLMLSPRFDNLRLL